MFSGKRKRKHLKKTERIKMTFSYSDSFSLWRVVEAVSEKIMVETYWFCCIIVIYLGWYPCWRRLILKNRSIESNYWNWVRDKKKMNKIKLSDQSLPFLLHIFSILYSHRLLSYLYRVRKDEEALVFILLNYYLLCSCLMGVGVDLTINSWVPM